MIQYLKWPLTINTLDMIFPSNINIVWAAPHPLSMFLFWLHFIFQMKCGWCSEVGEMKYELNLGHYYGGSKYVSAADAETRWQKLRCCQCLVLVWLEIMTWGTRVDTCSVEQYHVPSLEAIWVHVIRELETTINWRMWREILQDCLEQHCCGCNPEQWIMIKRIMNMISLHCWLREMSNLVWSFNILSFLELKFTELCRTVHWSSDSVVLSWFMWMFYSFFRSLSHACHTSHFQQSVEPGLECPAANQSVPTLVQLYWQLFEQSLHLTTLTQSNKICVSANIEFSCVHSLID